MKKLIRLTEEDLNRIVENTAKRIIKENDASEYGWKDFRNDAIGTTLGAGALGAGLAGNALYNSDEPEIDPQQASINQTIKDDLGQNVLKPHHDLPNDTISWEKANRFESKISKAIMESINNLVNEISDDTVNSAAVAAGRKAKEMGKKYGQNSHTVKHKLAQQDKFSTEYRNRWEKSNDAKKARMEKNLMDKNNGKRNYVKGKGWRTDPEEV